MDTFHPSHTSCEDLAWIQVLHAEPENASAAIQDAQLTKSEITADVAIVDEDDRFDNAVQAWLVYTKQGRNPIDAKQYIAELAKQHGITSGKWMFFVASSHADSSWTCLATAASQGLCGNHVKVSSRDSRGRHAFCVYVKDYLSPSFLDASRKEIEHLRLPNVDQLLFKPDIYSWLEIHAGNKWGISPVLYKMAYPKY